MKKTFLVCFSIIFVLGFMGCSSKHHMTAQQDLMDAKDSIRLAGIFGADPENSPEYKEALTNYSVAHAILNTESGGSLLGSLYKSKDSSRKASASALQAAQQAELALQNRIKNERKWAVEINALKNDMQKLSSNFVSLQEELNQFKEQARLAALQAKEEEILPESESQAVYSTIDIVPSQAEETDVVKEIQFKLLSEKEEEVRFILGSAMTPQIFLIKGKRPRMVCDFLGASPGSKIPPEIIVDGDLIKSIRTWHHKSPNLKLRVVLDLSYPFNHRTEKRLLGDKNIYIVKFSPAK